ncbi:14188_t:CDS:2, partial [Gigaspora margarita]
NMPDKAQYEQAVAHYNEKSYQLAIKEFNMLINKPDSKSLSPNETIQNVSGDKYEPKSAKAKENQ